jgi:metallophosphoesterase superfamily enzyme
MNFSICRLRREIGIVRGTPALFISRGSILVIGDMHIGIEGRYAQAGIRFNGSSRRMSGLIVDMASALGARHIVFLGDVKDSIMYPPAPELKELEAFFRAVCDTGAQVHIAKGNHDGHIGELLDAMNLIQISIGSEVMVSRYAFMHGNAMPSGSVMQSDAVFAAHGHFAFSRLGRMEKVFADLPVTKSAAEEHYGQIRKSIRLFLLPAFNSLIGGSAIGMETARRLPMLRRRIFNLPKAALFGTRGRKLGIFAKAGN